jgi:hypothetical protein
MQVGHLNPYLLYGFILFIYLPGLVAIVRMRRLALMPVITFSFLGMFLFTAVGSWLIITRWHFALKSLLTDEYVGMLILQALLFYAIAGPYVMRRSNIAVECKETRVDGIVRTILILAVVAILAAYYLKVGKFLLFDLLAGRINRVNILEFRALTWGLPEYSLFRLGFFVFPAIIAAQTVAMMSARGRVGWRNPLIILACLLPILLPAEKAAILQIAVILFIAYSLHLGMQGRSLGSALNGKVIVAGIVALVPTVVAYVLYLGHGEGIEHLPYQVLFRVIGAYSESLAATVRYADLHGFLHGATFPTFKGLFPHARVSLDATMHTFLAAGTELKGQPIPGGTPVPANGEGYINFGWPGFIVFCIVAFSCVVLVQELLLRLRLGATSTALMAWHGYLGFTLSTASLFGTFISLIHTLLAVGIVLLWLAVSKWSRRIFYEPVTNE